MSFFVGVDPGKSGGFAVINDKSPDKPIVFPWDDAEFVSAMGGLRIIRETTGDEIKCCLEKVGAMPGQGVTSMFSFGKSAGFIEGVLMANKIPYQLVPPQTWKKEFSLIHQDKSKSIETAQRLFPNVNFLPTERSRKPSDGMAEAALICLFASRHF